jgi:LacI family transcriptional regulator
VEFAAAAQSGVRVDFDTAAQRLVAHLQELGDREVILHPVAEGDALMDAWRAALSARMPQARTLTDSASVERMIGRSRAAVVICDSDPGAGKVLAAGRRMRCAVPQELSCVGFGDDPFAADLTPSLTTFRFDYPAIANLLIGAILALRGGRAPAVAVVVPKLVIRRSTAVSRETSVGIGFT